MADVPDGTSKLKSLRAGIRQKNMSRARGLSAEESRFVRQQLLSYALRHRRGWLAAIAAMFVATFILSLSLRQIEPILDDALPLAQNPATYDQGVQQIIGLLAWMVVLIGAGALLMHRARTYIAQLAERMLVDLRTDYHEAMMRHSPEFFREHEIGELVSIGMGDTEVLSDFLTQQVPFLLLNIGMMFVAFFFMLSLSWPLALACVALVLLLQGLNVRVVVPRLQQESAAYRRQVATVSARLNENLSGVRDIQAFAQEIRMTSRFRMQLHALANRMTSILQLASTNVAIVYLLTGLGLALIYGLGALGVVWFALGVGTLVNFGTFFWQFITPANSLSGSLVRIQTMIVSSYRVFDLMRTPPAIMDKPGAIHPGKLQGRIRFEDVSFSYAPDSPNAWRLSHVNLEIEPGEKVAFVGGSGSGKTSLLNLVARFYDVTEGRVTIDGYDVRDLMRAALRRNIGMVAQNVVLFQGTLADNIRFGDPQASDEAVEAAAEMGQVSEFAAQLPHGYDTELGEMGQGLSGGQKQRVSIARAILPDPSILILDEATSALDTQSEIAVMRALDNISQDRTTLVIAHRLNTIINADKIVLLGADADGNASVHAMGRHEELLETSDEYNALYHAKLARKVLLMPIGPMYNTVPILPTVVGLARIYEAPVYLLDFGPINVEVTPETRYGIQLGYAHFAPEVLQQLNETHAQRVIRVRDLLEGEGIRCEIVYPTEGDTWIDATMNTIARTNATHFVAMENILVPLDELRDSIRRIQRKTFVEYILVDPSVAAEDIYTETIRGVEAEALPAQNEARSMVQPMEPPQEIEEPQSRASIAQYGLPGIVLMFSWPALLFLLLNSIVRPFLRDTCGLDDVYAFLIIASLGSMVELALALFLTRRDGYALRQRLGLRGLNTQRQWLLFVATAVILIGAPLFLMVMEPALRDRFLPTVSQTSWPLAALLPLTWAVVNALGAEIYYRGYLLPKMRGLYGRYDWIANALLFASKALYVPWGAYQLATALGALAFAFFGKRRRVWASAALHYLATSFIFR
jgi:ABC-type multidrug transport system fused ATPase/permease subunit